MLVVLNSLIKSKTSAFLSCLAFLVVAACSSASESVEKDFTPSDATAVEVPELVPGEVTVGSAEISGTTVEYAVFVPDGFSIGDEAPLALAFPPGDQSLGLAESGLSNTYASEAQRLGWVVLSPAAPDGVSYFEGSETFVPELLDWTETWISPEGGMPHVMGISNGGASAFRYGVQNPDRLQSLVVLPGAPTDEDQTKLEKLVDVPIRMYAGSNNTYDVESAQQTFETLDGLEADIELVVFEGEEHVMDSTADGVIVFEQLESFR